MKLPKCPKKFKSSSEASKWMKAMGKALDDSNVPISHFISRRDNNHNFELARHLQAVAKRIKEDYQKEI